ncbi:MAG: TetR/AcrR family transcriptional regulator [Candidatus Korobacteraceae bacterium]
MRSTLRLLRKKGFAQLSIEAIAADAGVGKATVYRWWPSKGALVVDAFASTTEGELHFPDCGSVYKDVSLQMNQWLGVLRSPRGCIVAAVIAGGQSDAELIEAFRARFLRPRRQEAYQTLRRGIERGELPKDLDLDLVLDILYGAMYMRFLIRHDELSESYVKAVCQLVLQGAANGHRSSKHNGANGKGSASPRRVRR